MKLLLSNSIYICCDLLLYLFKKRFQTLLASNIELHHQTNDEPSFHANGADEVTALFQKYIFDNTSQVDIHSVSFKMEEENIKIMLIVEENKTNDGSVTRYLFEEKTTLQFEKNSHKISSIHTFVTRTNSPSKIKSKL